MASPSSPASKKRKLPSPAPTLAPSPVPSPALAGTAAAARLPSAYATPGFDGRLTAWVACLIQTPQIATAGPIFFDPTEPELCKHAAIAWCARQNAILTQQGSHEFTTGQRASAYTVKMEWRAFERGLNPAPDRIDNLFPAAGPYFHAAQAAKQEQDEAVEKKE